MRMHRGSVLGAMLAFLFAPAAVLADAGPAPLVELRAAAEAQADIDPDAPTWPRKEGVLLRLPHEASAVTKAESLTGASHTKLASEVSRVAIKEAIRGAVHEAVAREVADRPRLALGPSSGKGTPKANETAENDRSDAGQSRAAAAQSQQARQNQAVSQANRMARGQSAKRMSTTIPGPGKTKALP